jgi:hypothetical protein
MATLAESFKYLSNSHEERELSHPWAQLEQQEDDVRRARARFQDRALGVFVLYPRVQGCDP